MNKKILIVGLARNCSEVIFENIRTLKYAFSGHSVQFLVIESDSSDETVSELKKIKQKITDFEFISLGSLSDQFPLRTDRIAQCRNAYLSEINTNPKYSSIDFVVMADLDGVNQLLTPHAIASCWTRDDWDVCTANQKYAYYDIFALRHPLWSPNDCLKHYNFLRQYNVNKEKALYIAIHSKMLTIPKNSEWIEVDSAFGGLGIYKKNILSNLVYTGLDNDGNEICEHVPFHQQIRARGYKIFINPALINDSRKFDYMNRYIWFQTLRRYIKNLIIRPITTLWLRIKTLKAFNKR